MFYNINTGAEFAECPTTIDIFKGVSWDRATDRPILLEAGIRLLVDAEELPAGAVVTSATLTDDGEAVTRTRTWITAEQAAEADLVAKWTPEILQKLSLFRATMQRHFGAGAETNHDISQNSVVGYFVTKRMLGTLTLEELADSVILSTLYAELAPLCPDGTTWTAPYGRL